MKFLLFCFFRKVLDVSCYLFFGGGGAIVREAYFTLVDDVQIKNSIFFA